MKKQNQDLFAEDRRREKLVQYTKVLDTLSVLADWRGLAEAVNAATGREAARPKGGRRRAVCGGAEATQYGRAHSPGADQMIDATIVPAPKMHFTKEEKDSLAAGKTPAHWSQKQAAHKDTDAHWTAKRGQWHHGYKAHANVDQKHKLIRLIDITSANQSDMTHLEAQIDTRAQR